VEITVSGKGTCPICGEEEGHVHTILKCFETKLWSEVYIKNDWRYFGNEIR
jgi:hypothetical protein